MAEPKFEKDLEKLESIVEALEEGGLSLDASLKKFEDGIQLAKRCEKALSTAEKKIEKLTRSADGSLKATSLDGNSEESDVVETPSGAVIGGSEDDDDEDYEEDEDELLF